MAKAKSISTPRDEGQITSAKLADTVRSVLKRVRVDRRWDIPYLAGYSRAGRTIYIDRHLPRTFRYRGRRIRIDPFLILHEAVEIALLDKLDLSYHDAHTISLLTERAAVEAAGIPWKKYQALMAEHIKLAESKRLRRVPSRLNLTPYLDEKDLALLHKMLPLMYKDWGREK